MKHLLKHIALAITALLLSACGTTGETSKFALGINADPDLAIISGASIGTVAVDYRESYLHAVNVQPWGKFDAADLENIRDSLQYTFNKNMPEDSPSYESQLNIHLFIRRYVVSSSNTGGGVLATVAWAATDVDGKLVFEEQFYAWGSGFLVTTLGVVKNSVHKRIVRRVGTITMALATGTPASDLPPVSIENTSTSLDEAISNLPGTLVSMGNPGLASIPVDPIQTVGLLTPNGSLVVPWEPSKMSENFDWESYIDSTPQ